jgi:hypothetical protein
MKLIGTVHNIMPSSSTSVHTALKLSVSHEMMEVVGLCFSGILFSYAIKECGLWSSHIGIT